MSKKLLLGHRRRTKKSSAQTPSFAHRTRALREHEVLDASLTAFATHGCFHMTLDDVAQRVGIAKGTLYLHYPSREALLSAVLARACEQLQKRCWLAWKTAPNPAAGLRAVLASLMDRDQGSETVSPATLSRLQCGLIWKQRAPFRTGPVEHALEPVVTAWQQARLIDAGLDPRWVARTILALASGCTDERGEVPEGAERIATLVLRGLAPKGARPDSGKRARAQPACAGTRPARHPGSQNAGPNAGDTSRGAGVDARRVRGRS